MSKVELTGEMLKDCFQWDVTNWKRALTLWDPVVNTSAKLSCLEIGSRDGGLSLYLALHGHNVICSDLESPVVSAKKLHDKYGVTAQVKYKAVNALDIPYIDHFDIIIFKSVLGGVGRNNFTDRQFSAIDAMHRALKPGGHLLFAENLSGSFLHGFFRRTFRRWGREWNYPDLSRFDALLKNFTQRHIGTTGFLGAFGGSERSRNLFGKIDQGILHHLTPASWKYIIFGRAMKIVPQNSQSSPS